MNFYQWLENNLDIVYFIYGLSFFILGIAILVQPRKGSSFKLAEIIWLLAGFGIIHGINDFLYMWAIIKGIKKTLDLIHCLCLIVSYIALFEFGRRLFRITSQSSPHCQRRASRYFVWWLTPLTMFIIIIFGVNSYDPLRVINILTRYSFGFFGSFLTAFGFFFFYQCNKKIFAPLKTKGYIKCISFAFITYGILGGLIVPKGEFFPSDLINMESFLRVTHIPIQLFRSISAIMAALGIGGLLEIFNWEQRKKLQQSLDEWTNTFNAISDFVSVHDLDYRLVHVNKALADFLEKRPEQLIGMRCYEVFHNTKEPWGGCPITEIIHHPKTITTEIRDDNIGIPLLVTISPMFDESGGIIGSVHIAKDIKDIEKLNERDKIFINTSIDSFSVVNGAGRFIEVNDSYCSSYGYTRKEILSMNLADFEVIESSHDTKEHMQRIMKVGNGRFESQHRCKDGRIIDVEISVSYLRSEEVFFSFIRDVTERKRLMKELSDINLNLSERVSFEVEQNKIKDRLMAEQFHQLAIDELMVNLAHQWRQPLNVIGMTAQNIEDDYKYKELTNKSLNNSVKIIMDEVIKLSKTIKIFTNRYVNEEERQKIDISHAIKIGINSMNNALVSNNVLLETKIEDNILAEGYFNIITQAIINIITNSLEIFIERKIENRYIKIEAAKDTKTKKVIISLTDNGGGIEKEVIDKIFDPYFTTKFKARGKGLSLYLLKTMIERKMDGSMRIRNTEDGAEFIIEVCCYGS